MTATTATATTFALDPIDIEVDPPPFSTPQTLFTYSINGIGQVSLGDSQQRIFKSPPVNANLNYGVEKWMSQHFHKRLDNLVEQLIKRPEVLSKPSVITWRSVLTKIITRDTGRRFNVMLVGGNLYIEIHDNQANVIVEPRKPKKRDMPKYHGYAFESYCSEISSQRGVRRSFGAPLGWSRDVNQTAEWCHVVQNSLRDLPVVIGCEVDCVKPDFAATKSPASLIELKVTDPNKPAAKYARALQTWYTQSYLLNIPVIFLGFRNSRDGILLRTDRLETAKIPEMIKKLSSGDKWDFRTDLDFAERTLKEVRARISSSSQERPEQVWRLSFLPEGLISLHALGIDAEKKLAHHSEQRVGFLPYAFYHAAIALSS